MIKVIHVSISSSYGGGPEHIYQLIGGLPNQFENHVACPDNGPYFSKFKNITSGRITTLPFRKFKIKYLISLYRYIKKNEIDILHAHGKGAGFYCRIISMFIRIPVIYTPHGINQKIEQGFGNKLYLKFEQTFKSLISAIIFVSETESNYAGSLNIWPDIKSYTILNGTKSYSEEEIRDIRLKKRLEFGWENKKIVITASRFDFQKNTIEFCEVALLLPDITFVILGEGADLDDCRELCFQNKVQNVIFMGVVPDPSNYFAAANIYLSTARWEGLSMAILEAMAVGIPTVATDVIGNIDVVINGKTGFLYKLGDVPMAAHYISTVMQIEDYKSFSLNSRNEHENSFSSKAMCLNTASVYNEVLNKYKNRSTN